MEAASGSDLPLIANEHEPIRLYKRRWLTLALYSFVNLVYAMLWMSFAGIQTPTLVYYGKDPSATSYVNLLSYMVMGAYVPVTFVTIYFENNKELKVGISVGCVLMIVAGWVRYLSTVHDGGHYGVVVLGQVFTALGLPFLLNATTELAENWFGEKERSIATGIGALSNVLGNAAALVLGPALVTKDNPGGMSTFLLIEAIASTVVAGACLLLFRSHPPTPPSRTADHGTHDHFLGQMRECMRDRSFVLLVFGFSVIYASFNALPTLLNQIMRPWGYSDDQSGYAGAMLLGVGVVAAVVVGPLIDYFRDYKKMLMVGVVGIVASLLYAILSFRADNITNIYVSQALLGAFALPCLPIALESAVELTYPVSENVGNGILMMSGQLLSLLIIVIMNETRDAEAPYKMTTSTWIMFGMSATSLLCLPFVKPNYKRLWAEQAKEAAGQVNQGGASE